MNTLLFVVCIYIGIFVFCVIYTSELEYLLHRYIMHRPLGRFRYPFVAHALTHHRIYKYDASYHLIREEDKHTIPMAWWNGPILIIIASIPPLILSWLTGLWSIVIVSSTVTTFYYATYEYIHWCMHLPRPKRRFIEQKSVLLGHIFVKLNGHHLLHHRYMNKYNFNVVCPLADWVHGVLLIRSNSPFNQPRGHSVPDVQPRSNNK